MGWEVVAAIASVVAAVFAVLGFAYAIYFRWPRLTLEWRPSVVGHSQQDGAQVLAVRVEIVNQGGSTARHARLVIELAGTTITERTMSISPDRATRVDIGLSQPDQAEELPGGTVDLHGRTLRACVSYRRTRLLGAARSCAEY